MRPSFARDGYNLQSLPARAMPAKGTPAWHAAQKAQAGGKPQVDKTFGMKNKKGKAVQAKFHTQNGGADNAAQEKRRAEMKKAEQEAMNALLFQARPAAHPGHRRLRAPE